MTSRADLSDYHGAAGGHVKRTVRRRRSIVNTLSTCMCKGETQKRCRVTIIFRATAREESGWTYAYGLALWGGFAFSAALQLSNRKYVISRR